jgi:hypothetical protein
MDGQKSSMGNNNLLKIRGLLINNVVYEFSSNKYLI